MCIFDNGKWQNNIRLKHFTFYDKNYRHEGRFVRSTTPCRVGYVNDFRSTRGGAFASWHLNVETYRAAVELSERRAKDRRVQRTWLHGSLRQLYSVTDNVGVVTTNRKL